MSELKYKGKSFTDGTDNFICIAENKSQIVIMPATDKNEHLTCTLKEKLDIMNNCFFIVPIINIKESLRENALGFAVWGQFESPEARLARYLSTPDEWVDEKKLLHHELINPEPQPNVKLL